MPDEISYISRAEELENLLEQSSVEQVEQFFRDHHKRIKNILKWVSSCNSFHKLLSPNFIKELDKQCVRLICEYLTDGISFFILGDNEWSWMYYPEVSVSDWMYYPIDIIMSDQICYEKKAMFWHLLAELDFDCHVAKPFYMQIAEKSPFDVFLDNLQARKILYFYLEDENKRNFIRRTVSGIDSEKYGYNSSIRHFNPDDQIYNAVCSDQIALFEINRQVHDKNITVSMLLYLLHYKAIKCFLYLLTHFRKQVYKFRTETEWLFTVCRHFGAETAIPIIKQIEKDSPGIVASARDPWGNTLLWHTLSNQHNTKKIRDILIGLGCNPDTMNQWGLSFRIIQENTLSM